MEITHDKLWQQRRVPSGEQEWLTAKEYIHWFMTNQDCIDAFSLYNNILTTSSECEETGTNTGLSDGEWRSDWDTMANVSKVGLTLRSQHGIPSSSWELLGILQEQEDFTFSLKIAAPGKQEVWRKEGGGGEEVHVKGIEWPKVDTAQKAFLFYFSGETLPCNAVKPHTHMHKRTTI